MAALTSCLRPWIGTAAAVACLTAIAATPAAALTINVTFDASVIALPDTTENTIKGAFNTVKAQYEAAITNNITVNVNVGWGVVNTTPLTTEVGEALVNSQSVVGYSNLKTLLSGTGATLPTNDPTGGGAFFFLVPNAEAKALSLLSPTASGVDGYIGFSSSLTFDFDESNGVSAGQYDFAAVAKHELSHVLGRATSLTVTAPSPFYAYAADIFRYTSPGTNSFTGAASVNAYASTDGGTTRLGTLNDDAAGGDRSDWKTTGSTNDAQNAFMPTGQVSCLSVSDRKFLEALGYTFSGSASTLFKTGDACAPAGATASVNAAAAVPEPASLGLFAVGAGMIAALRRRRSTRNS